MITLSEQQEKAVRSVCQWFGNTSHYGDYSDADRASIGVDTTADSFYLGGYAGSGKTSILPTIIEALGLDPKSVAFGAPTGKAAKVMSGKLKAFGMPVSAATIHSLIYVPNREKIEMLLDNKEKLSAKIHEAQVAMNQYREQKEEDSVKRMKDYISTMKVEIAKMDAELDDLYDKSSGPSFSLNPNSQLTKFRLVVIDEASMVGQDMARDLKSFGVPVLAIGDPGQLPPVGALPGLCVGDPDFFLSEIHRQARDNPIIRLSQIVRQGGLLKVSHSSGDGLVEILRRRDDSATYDMDREAQVLVGTNKKRWRITKRLRREMGYVEDGPYEGEPLIICRNSRRFPELVNGTFVECAETIDMAEGASMFEMDVIVPDSGNKLRIPVCQGLLEENYLLRKGAASCSKDAAFRAKTKYEHVDFGHTITVHKSQGSQWDDVIVHDESGVFRDEASKWLYTAVTRAAERLTVVI